MYYFCYALLFIVIFMFGAAIGSFLNVCIYRLPKEESLTKVNSHCMSCGAFIQKRDLIPIFSWLILRGKCRSCRAKISGRYPLVESLNAVLYVLIFAYYGIMEQPLEAAVCCLVFSALIVVFFMDLDTQLISMYVVGFIGIMGAAQTLLDFLSSGTEAFISHGLGMAAGFVPLMLIVVLSGERAMGWGDAWLMLAGGLFLGIKAVVPALFIGLILGSVFGMIHKVRTGDSRFAFGPYLSLGIAAAVFAGEPVADWYLAICGF
ncbi:MAG: prepilin peptidase [Ruminococcus sp.]